jgi:hypothetical protein
MQLARFASSLPTCRCAAALVEQGSQPHSARKKRPRERAFAFSGGAASPVRTMLSRYSCQELIAEHPWQEHESIFTPRASRSTRHSPESPYRHSASPG